ncbi:LysR family transcriptional regulator|nr:LysR family transcriptional regulator [Candidatus Pantoea persica]
MVPRMYVERELNSGELVAPWPEAGSLSKRFYLVKPTETGMNEVALHAFECWLLAEINQAT